MVIQLPKVRYQRKEYFVDNRLREFRTVDPPLESVPFDSELGRKIDMAAVAAAIKQTRRCKYGT